MTRNQARIARFCLSYPGWQTMGQDSRATAVTLSDWGILERSEINSAQFRLALSADYRRWVDAAPAMLAALRDVQAFFDRMAHDGEFDPLAELQGKREAVQDAIAAATGER